MNQKTNIKQTLPPIKYPLSIFDQFKQRSNHNTPTVKAKHFYGIEKKNLFHIQNS